MLPRYTILLHTTVSHLKFKNSNLWFSPFDGIKKWRRHNLDSNVFRKITLWLVQLRTKRGHHAITRKDGGNKLAKLVINS